ncbi:MAG: hypothetical protein KGR26_15750, partial [Cyanobacteria bacterium REEB65]|nr:hypothetical protein [Cyanobacteria bacterium REEB65]
MTIASSATEGRQQRLKRAIFRRGAAALAIAEPERSGVYRCPLCLADFEESAIEPGGNLSLEHAPPQSIGGKIVCLTCLDCNNRSGHELDIHMQRAEAIKDFFSGSRPTPEMKARISFGGVTQRGAVRRTEQGIFMVGHPHRDPPGVGGAISAEIAKNTGSPSFNIEFEDGVHPGRMAAGWLRSAYLI